MNRKATVVNKLIWLFVCVLTMSAPNAFAQNKFTEGVLRYQVSFFKPEHAANMGNDRTPTDAEKKRGTYIIYVKNNKVREELQMESGFKNVTLSDYSRNQHYILKSLHHTHYALEADPERASRQTPRVRKFDPGAAVTSASGITVKKGKYDYRDGSSIEVEYRTDYRLALDQLFDRFPGLPGIPVKFDIPRSNGYVTHFELTSLTEEPVLNGTFRIPEGYRIISQKEYEERVR